ncbi:MAG: Glucose-6-phosphate isomerase [Steroidobacteraceae bacterium]|nr:Glucose-6-phosphate isomerase [Steroidobacteraceae bacterium]
MKAGPETAPWSRLRELAASTGARHLRDLFAADPQRFEHCSARAANLLLDFSRQRIDAGVLSALEALADAVDLRAAISAMRRGEAINTTEKRAVLHVALRQRAGQQLGGAEIERLVLAERARMLEFAASARERFRTVVNIGIGGSDLGPAMATAALTRFTEGAPRMAFVSNVDGCQISDVIATSDPATTLFIVASKTFTTLETQANARAARAWIAGALGEAAVPDHFAAVSVNTAAMNAFGVHPDYRFEMWDWVGGRYSIWSSIGVSLAIAIGAQNFLAFLEGGRDIDEHFAAAPWRENLPALAGLLGIWNVNFLGLPTLAILPYDQRLARFSAYLQQLEMESLGKSVTRDGRAVEWETVPVIWGEPGNNAQHSFFQMLHQGTLRAALDFLLPARSSCGRQDQHDLAIANCLAQAEAFAFGQPLEVAGSVHKVHAGNRPSTILAFDALDPATLGRLIALYEHKVFTQGTIWGINAFDQWGVELGKKLCAQLVPAVTGQGGEAGAAPTGAPAHLAPLLGVLRGWK